MLNGLHARRSQITSEARRRTGGRQFYAVSHAEEWHDIFGAGVIVARAFDTDGDVVPSYLPGGRVVKYVLVGPFERLQVGVVCILGAEAGRRVLAGLRRDRGRPCQSGNYLYAWLA
jgi:hypothetical protein